MHRLQMLNSRKLVKHLYDSPAGQFEDLANLRDTVACTIDLQERIRQRGNSGLPVSLSSCAWSRVLVRFVVRSSGIPELGLISVDALILQTRFRIRTHSSMSPGFDRWLQKGPFETAASYPSGTDFEPPMPRRSTAITVNRFAKRNMIF
jgi:hypothetical protein